MRGATRADADAHRRAAGDYSVDGRTVRPLGDENDKAFALMNALTAEQQKQATLAFEVRNLVLGPGADGKMIASEGVRASTFTQAQRKLLMDVAYEWVGILSDDAAAEGAGLSPLAAMMDIDTPMAIRMTARMRFPR